MAPYTRLTWGQPVSKAARSARFQLNNGALRWKMRRPPQVFKVFVHCLWVWKGRAEIGKISAEQWGTAMEDEAATGVQGVCPLPMGMKREDKDVAQGRSGNLVLNEDEQRFQD
ncbi:hypothetical protein THAOC_08785 [Thalassiosira oceanica]|uniref:Uncharacterized protein n=1 Tax=Thalassiosira oceanica TaxID=159749 RepID=K0THG1_THAOC|nr:hypothetical protein THAOC_08785 [Thalassiosira oceanica]|eukprot:EJK69917.1 hypothetical protein THAOC_08785 [Thalassiosira oceanica]